MVQNQPAASDCSEPEAPSAPAALTSDRLSTGASASPMSLPAAIASCCKPSSTASENNVQYSAIDRMASSFPGTGKVIPAGSELLSSTATTGIFSFTA